MNISKIVLGTALVCTLASSVVSTSPQSGSVPFNSLLCRGGLVWGLIARIA